MTQKDQAARDAAAAAAALAGGPPIELEVDSSSDCGTDCGMAMTSEGVERLAHAFERSASRWEMIAYPAMIIFTIFSAYGFYQFYSLTRDIRAIAVQLEPQMDVHMNRLTGSMQDLTNNIAQMSRSIKVMQRNVSTMSGDIRIMSGQMRHLQSIDAKMATMNRSIVAMTGHTDTIRWNMATMNRNISKPMGFMNSFMPW